MATEQANETESEIKLLIQENSKPQDLMVYSDGSVTKDLLVYTDGSVTKDLMVYTDGSVTKDLIVYTDGSVTKDLIVYTDGSVTKDLIVYTDGSVTKDLIVYTDGSVTKDLIVYTDGSVTKDHSGWGFTVKQGEATIHEDSAAYTVSTSSLTMELEAVTHALRCIASRGDSQTRHAIILTDSMSLPQKVKNGMGSPDRDVSMVDIHLRKLLST